jgi:hypothetical protein
LSKVGGSNSVFSRVDVPRLQPCAMLLSGRVNDCRFWEGGPPEVVHFEL